MDPGLLANVLALRSAMARTDRWDAERVAGARERRLGQLRRAATARSPFYARLHAGLGGAPLAELPIVTKSEVMANFDQIVTDHRVSLAGIHSHLAELRAAGGDPGAAWQGRWWTAATGGTTGEPLVLAWDRAEWASVLASYSRATGWAGVSFGPGRPLRMAVVSTLVPTHVSAAVGAVSRAPFVETLRLDARWSSERLATALDDFRPRILVGYASALRGLATAQLDGRLHIAPEAVMSASEMLSTATAGVIAAAWGRAPFDVYAATETAGIASMCREGSRHLYDDLVIVEPVDADGHLVPPGVQSDLTLVTVLFSRTIPLIRYALTDRLTLLEGSCGCGLPYRMVGPIGGRAENALAVPLAEASVTVDVEVLRPVVESFPVARWRAVTRGNGLELQLVPEQPFDAGSLAAAAQQALARVGAVPIGVRLVPSLPLTALGKADPAASR